MKRKLVAFDDQLRKTKLMCVHREHDDCKVVTHDRPAATSQTSFDVSLPLSPLCFGGDCC